MSKASEIVAIAKSQIGYREKAGNANLDDNTANAGSANWTKYARDLAEAGYYNGNKNGYAWCDVFVDWCFFKAYGAVEGQRIQCQTGDCGAGCAFSMQYYAAQGRFDSTPKIGDQLFFRYGGSSGADHTGIVVDITDTSIITIEGNSGDQVKQNTYSRSYGCIIGYGHPKYDDTDTINATETVEASAEDEPAPTVEEESYIVHNVVWGDTLWGLARKYLGDGTRYPEIKELNELTGDTIYVGQTLKIPN